MHANEVSVQFSSVTQSCLTLCDPMNRSRPGLPVHHQLKLMSIELVMSYSHNPPTHNPSQHQGIFQ